MPEAWNQRRAVTSQTSPTQVRLSVDEHRFAVVKLIELPAGHVQSRHFSLYFSKHSLNELSSVSILPSRESDCNFGSNWTQIKSRCKLLVQAIYYETNSIYFQYTNHGNGQKPL
jgi:hypothetical protein